MGSKRKRNGSSGTSPDSTVFLADYTVLKLIDLADADDSNEWPIFDLENVTVLDKRGTAMENGLMVECRGPFTVRGRLKIGRKQVSLLQPDYKHVTEIDIECSQCYKYSMGLDTADQALVYLSGPCGWFEIRPSHKYQPVYDRMAECVVLYFAMDAIYGERASSHNAAGRVASLDEAFLRYAIKIGDGSVREDILERCRIHSEFLHHHLKSLGSWAKTPFYQIIEEMAKSTKNTGLPASLPSASKPAPTRVPPIERRQTRNLQQSLPTRPRTPRGTAKPGAKVYKFEPGATRTRMRKSHQLSAPATVPSATTTPASASLTPQPGAFLDSGGPGLGSAVAAISAYWVDTHPKHSFNGTWKSVCNWIYFSCQIKEARSAGNMVAYYAKGLLQHLDKGLWGGTNFYAELEQHAAQGWAPHELDPHPPPFIFVKRKDNPRRSAAAKAHGALDAAEDALGVSVDDMSAPSGVDDKRGHPSNKTSSLRPTSLGLKKRSGSAIETEDSDGGSHRSVKLAKTSHYFSGDEDSADETKATLVIEAELLPSAKPRGPKGTWRCEFGGCDTILRRVPDQAALIQAHLQSHEDQAEIKPRVDEQEMEDELIQLARAEGKQSLLPINHLLDKIKRLGTHKGQRMIEVNGEIVSLVPPFQGRVLV